MDNSMNSLEQHFNLPRVRQIDRSRPIQWLQMGWQDMRENLGASLPYGIILAAVGYFILSFASGLPYLFTAAISGFFLIGPVAAAGLYEISRRYEEDGEKISFLASLRGLRSHIDSIAYFGAFLALVLIGWERVSAILFALFFQGELAEVSGFVRNVLLSGENGYFAFAYLVVGGTLAAVVFALSAVAIPMLLDRDTDSITAAMTSLRAVQMNFDAMAIWAAIIVALVLIGFASLMIGMVILLPLLGHASWHAYRDLVA